MSTSSPATPPATERTPLWLLARANVAATAELAGAASLPPLIAQLLLARGVTTADEAQRFLNPTIDDLLDPYSMYGMAKAVERVQEAVRERHPILIYGDYDVDGTTATVLLKTAIEMLGGEVRFHVPHRLREGYGMQGSVLELAAAEGVRLVISVDTGIRAMEEARVAERLGMDLIVTDHHLPEAALELPRALAILNPNQPGCEYACKGLCGAGVAFKLAQALLEADPDPDKRARLRTKILPSFLKMLAIATVADAVPLLGENRVMVAVGLKELRNPVNAGLRALMAGAKLDPALKPLTTMDIGFRLAPRINAAGRMDVASDVVEMFTTRDAKRAVELSEKLERLNTERRDVEAKALEGIDARLLDDASLADARCLVIDGDGWHRGVIGILASRVVDRKRRPAIVIARENGESYGSGRSIPGFHLLEAIESCADLFSRFGGHAHAVGFALPSERIPELRQRLVEYAAEHLTDEMALAPLECDAELALDGVNAELYSWLRKLEPVGMSNPEPVFVARGVRVVAAPRILKERHIKLQLAIGEPNGSKRGKSIFALGWHWAERAAALGIIEGSIVDVAYRIRNNEHADFGGLEIEISGLKIPG